jgi:hypothetical protein
MPCRPCCALNERLLDPLHTPYADVVSNFFGYFRLLLIVWTVAFLILRLRRPRRRLRQVACNWGTSGCIAALVFLVFEALDTIWNNTYAELLPLGGLYPSKVHIGESLNHSLGDSQVWAAIIAVWCVLKLGKRLRCERSWIEYFGLLLSFGWISTIFDSSGPFGWS